MLVASGATDEVAPDCGELFFACEDDVAETGAVGEVAATGAVSTAEVAVPGVDGSVSSVDVAVDLPEVPPAEETFEPVEDEVVPLELSDCTGAATVVVLGCTTGKSDAVEEDTGAGAVVVLACAGVESETTAAVTGAEGIVATDCAAGVSEAAGEVPGGVEVDVTGTTVLASGTISIRSWRGATATGGSAICTLTAEFNTDVTVRFCSSTWALGVTVNAPLT